MSLKPTPWGTPLDVITAVRRVNKILRARFDRTLDGMGLSYAQFEVLILLAQDRNLHAAAIARDLMITPQAVQKLVEKLRWGNLAVPLPKDGNVEVLQITDLGKTRLRQVRESLHDTDERLARLPQELRTSLVEALGSVERALSRPLDGNWD